MQTQRCKQLMEGDSTRTGKILRGSSCNSVSVATTTEIGYVTVVLLSLLGGLVPHSCSASLAVGF